MWALIPRFSPGAERERCDYHFSRVLGGNLSPLSKQLSGNSQKTTEREETKINCLPQSTTDGSPLLQVTPQSCCQRGAGSEMSVQKLQSERTEPFVTNLSGFPSCQPRSAAAGWNCVFWGRWAAPGRQEGHRGQRWSCRCL